MPECGVREILCSAGVSPAGLQRETNSKTAGGMPALKNLLGSDPRSQLMIQIVLFR
jgi:hypothetical protein